MSRGSRAVSGRETVLAHLVEDAAGADAEQTRRPGAISARRAERSRDKLLLAQIEGALELPAGCVEEGERVERRRRIGRPGRPARARHAVRATELEPELRWKTAQAKLPAALRRHERTADQILELTHVARQLEAP